MWCCRFDGWVCFWVEVPTNDDEDVHGKSTYHVMFHPNLMETIPPVQVMGKRQNGTAHFIGSYHSFECLIPTP